jgi:hypothetical protein
VRQIQDDYRSWVLENGFRDAIEAVHLFLDEVRRIADEPPRNQRGKSGTDSSSSSSQGAEQAHPGGWLHVFDVAIHESPHGFPVSQTAQHSEPPPVVDPPDVELPPDVVLEVGCLGGQVSSLSAPHETTNASRITVRQARIEFRSYRPAPVPSRRKYARAQSSPGARSALRRAACARDLGPDRGRLASAGFIHRSRGAAFFASWGIDHRPCCTRPPRYFAAATGRSVRAHPRLTGPRNSA